MSQAEHDKLASSILITTSERVAKETAEELEKQHGIAVDKRKILLNDTIKAFGTYSIDVKLHTEVTGKLNVVVIAKD